MESFSSVPSSRSSSPLPEGEESSFMNDVASVNGDDSRPGSPIASTTTKLKSVINGDGRSVKSFDSTTDPDTAIKSTIRAHSVTAQDAFQQAIAEQNNSRTQFKSAEKAFDAIHIYQFNTRATLHKASLKAQIKFNGSTGHLRLEQAHVSYLEALSRSSLSSAEQHEKYSLFKKTLDHAHLKCLVATFDEEASVGCSASMIKSFAAKDAASKTAALESEQLVQKLLKDIQQPHTELRNNIAQNLSNRKEQLHHLDASSNEALRLKADMSAIRAFQAVGGLDSLSQAEAAPLNALLKDANTKYNAFQKEAAAFKKAPSTTNTTSLHSASVAFQAADAAVMATIRELGGHLKGPPELRKDLVTTLRHKEALRASATGDEAAKLDEETTTLKTFLESQELAALNSKAAAPLATLVRAADQKYANWQRLETAAKALEAAANTATAEPSEPQPKDAPTVVVPTQQAVAQNEAAQEKIAKATDAPPTPPPTAAPQAAPTKEEIAKEKAKQEKMEARKALVANANQTRQAADAARTASEEADADVMNKITTLLHPTPPLPAASLPVVLPVLAESKTPAESKTTIRPIQSREAIDDDIADAKGPPPSRSPLNTSSSTVTAAGNLSAPPAKEDLASLRAFAERSTVRIQDQINEQSFDKLQNGDLDKQLASLQKFLALDAAAIAALPSEKLKGLVDQMKKIEVQEKEIDTVLDADATAILEQTIAALETQFIAALEK